MWRFQTWHLRSRKQSKPSRTPTNRQSLMVMEYRFRFFPWSLTDMDMTLNPINRDEANFPATHNGDGNMYFSKQKQTAISRTLGHFWDFDAIYVDQYDGRMEVEVGDGHVFRWAKENFLPNAPLQNAASKKSEKEVNRNTLSREKSPILRERTGRRKGKSVHQ